MIGKNKVDVESSVKLLGISIENQPSFNQHIRIIWKSASYQLKDLGKLETFLGFELNFSYEILLAIH